MFFKIVVLQFYNKNNTFWIRSISFVSSYGTSFCIQTDPAYVGSHSFSVPTTQYKISPSHKSLPQRNTMKHHLTACVRFKTTCILVYCRYSDALQKKQKTTHQRDFIRTDMSTNEIKQTHKRTYCITSL